MQALYQLAGLYGMQTAYMDVSKRRHQASVDTLLSLLRSLGAPVDTLCGNEASSL